MTFEEFKDDILTQLGGNLVDVELEDKEIQLAFKKAKRTFQQKGHNSYRRAFISLDVNKEQVTYQLPADVYTVVKAIKQSLTFSVNDSYSLAAYNDMFGSKQSGNTGDYLSYEFTLQSIEMWRRYLAFDVQFHFDEFAKTITFLKPPEKTTDTWLIELYTNLTDEEYMDVLWIQEWAAAEAKQMLGMAYRKFSQLPGPDGSVSLDGSSLIQEAKQEKEQLLEDILNGLDGASDYYEIRFG